MKVWIVVVGMSCEGDTIEGVFNSKEKAEDYMKTHPVEPGYGQGILEYEVE